MFPGYMYTDVLFFVYYAVVTELLFLTASTIRTTPVISKIPPITGKATSKPQDSFRPPKSCEMEKKRKERRIACVAWNRFQKNSEFEN